MKKLLQVILFSGGGFGFLLAFCGPGQLLEGKFPYLFALGPTLFVVCWFLFDMINRKERCDA